MFLDPSVLGLSRPDGAHTASPGPGSYSTRSFSRGGTHAGVLQLLRGLFADCTAATRTQGPATASGDPQLCGFIANYLFGETLSLYSLPWQGGFPVSSGGRLPAISLPFSEFLATLISTRSDVIAAGGEYSTPGAVASPYSS